MYRDKCLPAICTAVTAIHTQKLSPILDDNMGDDLSDITPHVEI